MSFQAKDPRDLVSATVRIPRQHRQRIQHEARRRKMSDAEIHRRALALGLKALEAETAVA